MNRRIRVVEIVGNGEGGGAKCVAEIVRHLDAERFACTVISPESTMLTEVCARQGARFCRLPLLESRMNRQFSRSIAEIVEEVQPDIINAHGPRAAWYCLRAKSRLTRAPALVYSEHLFSFHARSGPKRVPWFLLERYICRHADALTTSCAQNAALAERRGWIAPERIALRHYGIDQRAIRDQVAHRLSRAHLQVPDDAPLIGTVGRLIPQKGVRYLLDAARIVVNHVPSAVFLIVGEGELRAQLEEQSRQLGLAGHVRFLGAHDEPWRILGTCDVVAFASLWEGLPFTGIEALVAGRPVVFTRMKGTEEIIHHGENGLLVPPRDADALAKSILLLLRVPMLRGRLGAAGPSSVADREISTVVERFGALYERLSAGRVGAQARAAQALAIGPRQAR